MRKLFKFWLFLLVLLWFNPAFADSNNGVKITGAQTVGDCVQISSTNVLVDTGSACGSGGGGGSPGGSNGQFQFKSGSSFAGSALLASTTGGVTIGGGALATTATTGYLYIPTVAGVPTGVPTANTGYAAVVYDTPDNRYYVYNSGWSGLGTALSSLTGAVAGNTMDSGANAQIWTANALTTGTFLSLSTSTGTSGNVLAVSMTTSGSSGAAASFTNTATGTTGYAVKVNGALLATSTVNLTGLVTGTVVTGKYMGLDSSNHVVLGTPGGGGTGGPMIKPEQAYTADTAGNLFPYLYTGGGGNAAPSDWNWGVVASLGSDVVLQLRFMMPTAIPSGTFKLFSWCKANASTGNALYTPSDGFVAAGSSESAATLTSDSQITVSPTGADVPVLSKTTLSASPLADGVSIVALTFNHTSYTLAQILACRFYEGWE